MKKRTKLLRNIIIYISLSCGVATYSFAGSSESYPKVTKEWFLLEETKTHIEFSGRVIKCDENENHQLHLKIFNENAEEKNVNFKVTILDKTTGKSIEKTITLTLGVAAMINAACDSSENSNLKIEIPSDYNAENLDIKLQLN